MRTAIEKITPHIAETLLAKNSNNRTISHFHIDAMARDMKHGRWELTGEAIKISPSGHLLDGQHRLMACVKAGRSFQTLVIYDLPSYEMGDAGSKRTYGNVLQMSGVKNGNATGAAAQKLISLAHEVYNKRSSRSEVVDLVRRQPDIAEWAGACSHIGLGLGSIVAGVAYAGARTSGASEAGAFVEVFRTGVPFYDGDPAHLVRERIIRTRGTTSAIQASTVGLLVAQAWRSFSRMEAVRLVKPAAKFSVDGWTPHRLMDTMED
jgi:hypothetical protein